jgi:hypothetical protein
MLCPAPSLAPSSARSLRAALLLTALGGALATSAHAQPAPDPELCSGEAAGLAIGVVAPAPPAAVDVPLVARCVASTTAELVTAMSGCLFPDIVLRPGVYPPGAFPLGRPYLSFLRPRRLWAESPGAVILQFGLHLGAHSGSELHGLQVELTSAAHAALGGTRTAAILWAKNGAQIRVEDTIVRGHASVEFGVLAGEVEGAHLHRVVAEDFLRFGVRVYQDGATEVRASLSDLVVRGVGDPAWRQSPSYRPGTEEHGLWLAGPALVERARIRDVWWAGIGVGDSEYDPVTKKSFPVIVDGVSIIDADIDRVGVGDGHKGAGSAIGFERITHGASVRRFCVGPDVERGVNLEWNQGHPGEEALDVHIMSGAISAQVVGVYVGSGATGTVLQNLSIADACWAGVGLECAVNPAACLTQLVDLTWLLPPNAVPVSTAPYPLTCP